MRIVIPIFIQSQNLLVNNEVFNNLKIGSFIYNYALLSGDIEKYFLGLSQENKVSEIKDIKNKMHEKLIDGFYNNILIDNNINNYRCSLHKIIYLCVNKYLATDLIFSETITLIGYHAQRSIIEIDNVLRMVKSTSSFSFIQFESISIEGYIILEIAENSNLVFNTCKFINCKIVVQDSSIVEFNDCHFIGSETVIIQRDNGCIKSQLNPMFTNVKYQMEIENLNLSTLPWMDCNIYDNMVSLLETSLIENYYLNSDFNFRTNNLVIKQKLNFVNDSDTTININIDKLICKTDVFFSKNIILNTNIFIENVQKIKICLNKFNGQINLKNIESVKIYNTDFIPIDLLNYIISAVNCFVILSNVKSYNKLETFCKNVTSEYLVNDNSVFENIKLLMDIDPLSYDDENELIVDLIKPISLAVVDSTISVSFCFDDLTVKKFIAKNSIFTGGLTNKNYIELSNVIVDISNCDFNDIPGTVISLDNKSTAIIKETTFNENVIAINSKNSTQLLIVNSNFNKSSNTSVLIDDSIAEIVSSSFSNSKYGVYISGFKENDEKIDKCYSVYYDVGSTYSNNYLKSIFIGYGSTYKKIDYNKKDDNE